MNTHRTTVLTTATLALSLFLMLCAGAQEQGAKVEEIFQHIEHTKGVDLWTDAGKLIDLGRPSLTDVRKGFERADHFVHVAAAKYLYHNNEKGAAIAGLVSVLKGDQTEAQKAAAELLNTLAVTDRQMAQDDRSKAAEGARKLASATTDDFLKIALWKCVWHLTEDITAKRELRPIVRSANKEVRAEAALALAEMDTFTWAKNALTELAAESSERGKLARAYLKINELTDELDRQLQKSIGAPEYDYALLDEIVTILKNAYYEPDKVKVKDLIENAARGLAASLDPYTMYHDEEAMKRIFDDLEQQYAGIGARVSMRKDKSGAQWLTIEEPIFSGPAYEKGLRSNDKIVEIEGESTVNKEIMELVNMLRGEAGTSVKIKVYRRGWKKEKEYELTRRAITLDSTLSQMLPGNIGYIKMLSFGKRNVEEVADAIDKLEADGMKALVFDLRGNSGGYLDTAIELGALFLDNGKTIVTTKTRGKPEEIRKAEGTPKKNHPTVFLVDGGSASASEILAGAMQDHKRATLIGERTFGKGLVQDIRKLKASGEKTGLRVTISKWFLPSGRSIEKDEKNDGGILPDIVVETPERDLWKEAEFDRIRTEGKIEDYVKENFPTCKDLFSRLAESDALSHAEYPEFDRLYGALNTKASKEEIREIVREYARKAVADDRGRAWIVDVETDIQLQRAILELGNQIGIDCKKMTEYSYFAEARKGDKNPADEPR